MQHFLKHDLGEKKSNAFAKHRHLPFGFLLVQLDKTGMR